MLYDESPNDVLSPEEITIGAEAPIAEQFAASRKASELHTLRGVTEYYRDEIKNHITSVQKATGAKEAPISDADIDQMALDFTSGSADEKVQLSALRTGNRFGGKPGDVSTYVNYDEKMKAFREANPNANYADKTRAQLYSEVTSAIEKRQKELDAPLDNTRAGFFGSAARLGGSLVGFMSDPVNILASIPNANPAVGVLKYIAQSAAIGAVQNAGMAGLVAGARPEMENKGAYVAQNALLGAAVAGGFAGIIKGAPALTNEVEKLWKWSRSSSHLDDFVSKIDAAPELSGAEAAAARADAVMMSELYKRTGATTAEQADIVLERAQRASQLMDEGRTVTQAGLDEVDLQPRFNYSRDGKPLTNTPSGAATPLIAEPFDQLDEAVKASRNLPEAHVTELADGKYAVVKDAPHLAGIATTETLQKAQTVLRNGDIPLFNEVMGGSPHDLMEIVQIKDGFAIVPKNIVTPQLRAELAALPRQFLDDDYVARQAFKGSRVAAIDDIAGPAPGSAIYQETPPRPGVNFEEGLKPAEHQLKLASNFRPGDLEGYRVSEDLEVHLDKNLNLMDNLKAVQKHVAELLDCAKGGI